MSTAPANPPLNGLRERRVFRGLNQKQAGDLIGVGQSHYRQFETGHVRLDIQRAKKLADAFDCTIEELL
jgi:transcriptional regulator with XRE-family HTH domain